MAAAAAAAAAAACAWRAATTGGTGGRTLDDPKRMYSAPALLFPSVDKLIPLVSVSIRSLRSAINRATSLSFSDLEGDPIIAELVLLLPRSLNAETSGGAVDREGSVSFFDRL